MDRINKINRIKDKIDKIVNFLNELKKELELFESEIKNRDTKKNKTELSFDKKELKNLYERLYSLFQENKREEIINIIESKTKKYLKAFCSVNNLPIDPSKVSKKRIAEEVLSWLSQRKEITKEIT